MTLTFAFIISFTAIHCAFYLRFFVRLLLSCFALLIVLFISFFVLINSQFIESFLLSACYYGSSFQTFPYSFTYTPLAQHWTCTTRKLLCSLALQVDTSAICMQVSAASLAVFFEEKSWRETSHRSSVLQVPLWCSRTLPNATK